MPLQAVNSPNAAKPEHRIDIPGYDILEKIGQGGMATVYRARQHTFNRDVALKILRQDLSEDSNFSHRFLMESMIIAKLHHSHIVQVYDVGEVHQHFYIAMEFLSGGDLRTHLQEGLSIQNTITIMKQTAAALDYAHQKGIIHRDIKPDNIMFREDGAAVLTDFGIAKDGDAGNDLTQTGVIMGTPKYMSPEQIRGAEVRAPSDLYSLGVVFYQMLSNELPYNGKDIVATAFMQVNDPIPTLPPSLERFQNIINKVLAKHVADRYQHGNEIVRALDGLSRGDSSVKTSIDDGSTMPSHFEINEQDRSDSSTKLSPTVVPEESAKRSRYFTSWIIAGVMLTATFGSALLWYTSRNTIDDKIQIEQIQQLLSAADTNIENLNLRKPKGNNAYDKLHRILDINPNNSAAIQGIHTIAEKYIELANNAIATGDSQQAHAYLAQAEELNPQSSNLKQVTDNLATLDSINKKRKENILSIREELQIEGLLQSAAIDERDGRLQKPKEQNAFEKYQKVLSINPENKIALKKIKEITAAK